MLKINIKYLILLIPILFLTKNSFASPQVPDYLIYQNDTIPVYNLILEKYFEKINKPDKGKLFGLSFREGSSLNCWRGYQAIYKIENDSIFLDNIFNYGDLYSLYGERNVIQQKKISISKKKMKSIFKDKFINGKVFIDWLNDDLSIRNGKLLRWDGVFHKTYEKEILFEIKKGRIRRIKEIENYIDEPKRINRRYRDTISKLIFQELDKLDWKKLDEMDCSEEYTILIGENGKIKSVSMTAYKEEEIDEMWERKEYNYCVKSILKGLKKLRFDIIKQKGERVTEKVYLELWYDKETGKLENWNEY